MLSYDGAQFILIPASGDIERDTSGFIRFPCEDSQGRRRTPGRHTSTELYEYMAGAGGAINGIVGMYLALFYENEITCYWTIRQVPRVRRQNQSPSP